MDSSNKICKSFQRVPVLPKFQNVGSCLSVLPCRMQNTSVRMVKGYIRVVVDKPLVVVFFQWRVELKHVETLSLRWAAFKATDEPLEFEVFSGRGRFEMDNENNSERFPAVASRRRSPMTSRL